MSGTRTWLALSYRVPTEPSRLRAAVWRRVKALGAIYLQNSLAIVPASPNAERALRTLRREIVEQMNGHAVLLSGIALAGEAEIVAALNEARDDEYEEILDKCRDFVAGIEKEIAANHLTYGELEENDEDLAKLQGWFKKVSDRDTLGAAGRPEAEAALARCTEALDQFAARVYELDNV